MCRIVNDCNTLCRFGKMWGFHPHGVTMTQFPEFCSLSPVCARLCSNIVPTFSFFDRHPSMNGYHKKEMSNG